MQVERSNEDFSVAETQIMMRELRLAVTAMLENVSRLCRPGAITIFDYFQRYYLDVLKRIDSHDLSNPIGIAAARRHTEEIRKVSAACLECMRTNQAASTGEHRTPLHIQQRKAVAEAKTQWLH